MNSISMNFRSLYCKIPHNNLSSAHVIFDISLGERQHCCDQSGTALYEYVCALWQGCCNSIVFIREEFCPHSYSLRLCLLLSTVWHQLKELHYLPLFEIQLKSIHKTQVIEMGRQTHRQLLCKSHFFAKLPHFFSFLAWKKAELSSSYVQLKA